MSLPQVLCSLRIWWCWWWCCSQAAAVWSMEYTDNYHLDWTGCRWGQIIWSINDDILISFLLPSQVLLHIYITSSMLASQCLSLAVKWCWSSSLYYYPHFLDKIWRPAGWGRSDAVLRAHIHWSWTWCGTGAKWINQVNYSINLVSTKLGVDCHIPGLAINIIRGQTTTPGIGMRWWWVRRKAEEYGLERLATDG